MYKSRKWSSALKAAVLVMPMIAMSVAGAHSTSAAPAQQAGAQTFNATVGHEIFTEEGEKSSWQDSRFFPGDLTINVGDTIHWKFDSGLEPHTVSFLGGATFPPLALPEPQPAGPPKLLFNPLTAFPQGGATFDGSAMTSSGVVAADIPGPKDYSLTFTKPGTYSYYCLLHAQPLPDGTIVGMQAKVIVQAAGSAYPKSDAQVQSDVKAAMAADEQTAKDTEPKAKSEMVTSRPGDNGTTIYHVNSGYQIYNPTYILDYMRFAPSDMKLNIGDSIEWSSPTPHSFHNVLFGEEPEFLLTEPQPAGPPKIYINSDVAFPAGDNDYSGSGLYSSGLLAGPEDPPEAGAHSYSLTFSQPGRFEYICAIHYHNGMDGTVTVADNTGGVPGMPTTGSGSDSTLPLLALLAGLVLASTGVGLRLRTVARR